MLLYLIALGFLILGFSLLGGILMVPFVTKKGFSQFERKTRKRLGFWTNLALSSLTVGLIIGVTAVISDLT